MNSKTKYLSAITALSLLCMLGLQLYFLYSNYQSEREGLLKDLRTSVELVTEEVLDARETQIHEFYLEQIQDTTLIKIAWNWVDMDEPVFSLQDAKTGKKVLSYSINDRNPTDSVRMQEVMDRFLSVDPKTRVYFGLTEEADNRIKNYRDTVSLNLELYGRLLDERLAEFDIKLPFEFRYLDLDSLTTAEDLGYTFYANMPKAIEKGLRQPTVIVEKPLFDVLKRMYVIVLASIVVVVLIAVCFISLIRTINRQRKLSALKDDFIDSMTHELLTPIATLKISLETLDQPAVRADEARANKYLNISKMELSRVSDIVHNVLYSSLHEQKDTKLKIEPLNVNDLLDGLVRYHSEINEAANIDFKTLEEPWVNSDKQHLTNVLHNLIDNGIKYAGDNANITIIPTRQGSELNIVVNDNGRGIPEAEQQRIFDKFYRAKEVQDIKGLGVGLYYVKSILTRLHGSIELLHSSPKGSSFRVSLDTTASEQ